MRSNAALACLAMAFAGAPLHAGPPALDPALPEYQAISGISGTLNSIGSDTLNNLMTFWAEGFQKLYPNVRIQIEGKGSSTAPPALVGGTAQLGPMSRKMKSEELNAFQEKFGYPPTAIGVAIDALAIYVHKDNPISHLSLQQVDAIFSGTRKRGAPDNIATWGQLGLSGDWANRPLSLYGRNSASGTYGFFKEFALKNGDFKPATKEQPGSASVVQGIENDLGAIGYSGIGYRTAGVRALPVADKGDPIEPDYDNAASLKYPISRFLYVYINRNPGAPTDTLVREFVRFVCSKEGQQAAIKDGYYPLTAAQAARFEKAVE